MTALGYILAIEPPCWACGRRPSEVSVTVEGERREVCTTCLERADEQREDADDCE